MAEKKKRSSSTAKSKAASKEQAAKNPFPKRIYATASPHSVGGVSLFHADALIDASTVSNFDSDPDLVQRATQMLEDAGFEVLAANTAMINFCGPRRTFERAFATEIHAEEREVVKAGGVADTATFFDTADTDLSGLIDPAGSDFAAVLEGVAIEEPYYLAAGAVPPTVDGWHLQVPGGVSVGLNADKAHRSGFTGKGVKVAMTDTGWFRHPFFTDRGYRAQDAILGPGAADPLADDHGHGTGESANIFAAAPDVELLPVKIAMTPTGGLVNTTAAFNEAVALNPDIITNSWSASIRNGPLSASRQAQAAAVAAAVAQGIVVCFSAGNGSFGFPAQHPDVISVGGVFRDEDGSLEASDYASGFVSNIYPGRQSPDVCGLVGMRPGAEYIMLPVQEGSTLDVSKSATDGTTATDGWALFSGTSASCPQIAGVIALIKQACPRLTPAEIKGILQDTAIDITAGASHAATGGTTGPGVDTATGHGLVDAARAVAIARLRCLVVPLPPVIPFVTPRIPFSPFRPPFPPFVTPRLPLTPLRPPLVPIRPPLTPFRPFGPVLPLRPLRPLRPFLPTFPFRFSEEADPASAQAAAMQHQDYQYQSYQQQQGQQPGAPGGALTADEVAYLEQLVVEHGEDLLDGI